MDNDEKENGIAVLAFILIGAVLAGFFILATSTEKSGLIAASTDRQGQNKYIPLHDSAYVLVPKKRAYVYKTPAKRKRLAKLTHKKFYIPDDYLVSENYGGSGEGEQNDPIVLGKKHLKFAKTKSGLAPVMQVDRVNYEEYANGNKQNAARQKWDTRHFIDLSQFKVTHVKNANLYQLGKKRQLFMIDNCNPYVFNKKKNKKDDDDDTCWWLPIYLYQSQNQIMMNSEDDDNAMRNTNENDDEINSNATSHPSEEEDEENNSNSSEDNDENTGSTSEDEDENNAPSDSDDEGSSTTEEETPTEEPTESETTTSAGEE